MLIWYDKEASLLVEESRVASSNVAVVLVDCRSTMDPTAVARANGIPNAALVVAPPPPPPPLQEGHDDRLSNRLAILLLVAL